MNITAATPAARFNDAGDVKLDDVQINVVLGHSYRPLNAKHPVIAMQMTRKLPIDAASWPCSSAGLCCRPVTLY